MNPRRASCLVAAVMMLTVTVFPARPGPSQAVPPYKNPNLGVEQRTADLVARMTLEEKIGQMSQATAFPRPLSDRVKEEICKGRWGSFLNAGNPEDRIEAQRVALTESRLGIPLIYGRDVIHGYRTIFPIPLGQAASWDPDLIRQAARVAGRETAAAGIHWTFAPMIDIARDPRWGRIAEGLGEDPYLASILGAAMVRGFQGESLSAPDSIAACAKHYVGYGAAEGDEIVQCYVRDLVGSVTRPVRELKGFRRIRLKPGEKKTVEFSLSTKDLAFYDDRGELVTEPGMFHIWIAPDSASGLKGEFEVVR